MTKIKVSVDEKFPIFGAEETHEDGDFIISVDDDFYNKYLLACYKYYEVQKELQVIYDEQYRQQQRTG